MTTKDLLRIVHERGLRIYLKNGQPLIERPPENRKDAVTDRLLAVLKVHREWIIEHLKREQKSS